MRSGNRTTIIGVAVIMLVIGVAIGSVVFPATKTETSSFANYHPAHMLLNYCDVYYAQHVHPNFHSERNYHDDQEQFFQSTSECCRDLHCE